MALFLATNGQAELKWHQQQIERDATFEDSKIIVDFEFTNQGSAPVTITDTKTSCGCTVTKLDKKTYQPGESGAVSATFDVGQRVGKQVKHITVSSDERENVEGYDLILTVNIPKAITLQPRVVTWKTGAEATSKNIKVTLHKDFPLTIESVIPQNDDANDFNFEILEVLNQKSYTVVVTPKSTNARSRGRLLLQSSEDGNNTLSRHLIYAFIR